MAAGIGDPFTLSKQIGGTSMEPVTFRYTSPSYQGRTKVTLGLFLFSVALLAAFYIWLWPIVVGYYFLKNVYELWEDYEARN